MKFENLLACMRDSKLPLPPQFARARNDMRVPEYYALYDKTIKDIERHVYFGANYGFSGKVKATIIALAEQVVLMSKQTNAGRFGEIERRIQDVQASTNNTITIRMRGIEDMKQRLLEQIEAYKNGMYVMATIDVAEDRRDILDAGTKKMERLIELLGEVSDVSSANALERAQAIKDALERWAKDVSMSMHSQRSLTELDKAIRAAESWVPLHVAPQGFFKKLLSKLFGKKVDVASVQYVLDELGRIGQSAEFLEKTVMFSQNLEDYVRNKEAVWNLESDNAKIAQIERQMAALKDQEVALVERCKNGEITQDQLLNAVKPIRGEVARLERQAQDIRRSMVPKVKNRNFYLRLSGMMERLFEVIRGYRNEPTQITRLGKYLDFEALTRLMRGEGDENDNQVALTLKRMEDVIIAHNTNQMEHLFEQWEAMETQMEEGMEEEVSVGNQNQRTEEDARLLEELLGVPAAAAGTAQPEPAARVETEVFNGIGDL